MKNGFTVVEVMVLIMILLLIASVAIPSFIKARNYNKKQEHESKQNLNKINDYRVTFLFEENGVRVYRFVDPENLFKIEYFTTPK